MINLKLHIDESFYKEEIRDGYTISSEMKKLWAVELDLLNEFMNVCKRNKIMTSYVKLHQKNLPTPISFKQKILTKAL